MIQKNNIFKNGSIWLKADFHLHTRADKEFKYDGEENYFVKSYIEQLKKNEIGIGIITNHNKFDLEEYKELRKSALKVNIYLIPGVELSVNDGRNGIHTLIAFEYETWITNNDNFIEQFLNSCFEGIANCEHRNTRCKYNLSELFKKLDNHREDGRDTFIIMAHIEQCSGFCEELDGGRIMEFAEDESFKRNVLAFQKIRTNDLNNNLITWFGSEKQIPAYVEGSDCKKIDEIGICGTQKDETGKTIEKQCFIKIGDFNFEAVKYTLTDKENRISMDIRPKLDNAYIKSISFDGGLLDGTEINFSPELNNFIGIRGSGKSSVIEILRYTLGINAGKMDTNYKNDLIEHVLKSGGKVITTVVNEYKKEFRIEKIFKQKADIYENNSRIDAPAVNTVFKIPVYFGQKDLSNKDIDFEADLIKKLIGNRLDTIKSKTAMKIAEIEDIITASRKLENLEDLKKEINGIIKNAEYRLKIFTEKKVEDKLRQQGSFDSDENRLSDLLDEISKFNNQLDTLINNYSDFFKQTMFKSEENKEIFLEAEKIFKGLSAEFNNLISAASEIIKYENEFGKLLNKLKEKKENLKEEFAKIRREINIPNLNTDEYPKLKREIETSRIKLKAIEKSEKKKSDYIVALNNKISELNNLWHEEYQILEREVKRINDSNNQLNIEIEYKGRKDKFLEKQTEIFRGSRITEPNYKKITEEYKDFIEIYKDQTKLKDILNENQFVEYKKRLFDDLGELLTFRIEDKFTIKYNGKPLDEHSLGQRATGLILFLLAQKETDVLIIDQPEDDLDNQTIYEDVIKEIKSLKGKMQFIFATHNANIPVLGDSEKIISCKYTESKIEVQEGTIDNHDTQKEIVTIMEGGEEAFNRRKNIYELWSLKK